MNYIIITLSINKEILEYVSDKLGLSIFSKHTEIDYIGILVRDNFTRCNLEVETKIDT